MLTPSLASRSIVAGPTPGIARAGSPAMVATSVPGSTSRTPSGLASSLATFAMNFELPSPTDAVRPPVAAVSRARRSSASPTSEPESSGRGSPGGEVDERLVEAQRLHQG